MRASVEKQAVAGGVAASGKDGGKGVGSGMWNYRGLVKSRPDRYRLMLGESKKRDRG